GRAGGRVVRGGGGRGGEGDEGEGEERARGRHAVSGGQRAWPPRAWRRGVRAAASRRVWTVRAWAPARPPGVRGSRARARGARAGSRPESANSARATRWRAAVARRRFRW